MPAADAPAIEIRDLHRSFGDVQAVRGLDLTIERGQCLGFLGPNGAGKSTTIHIIVGLDRPTRGEVKIFGEERAANDRAVQERIGVQLQETQFVEKLTVDELLRLFQSFYRKPAAIADVRARIALDEKRNARYRTLSGGQKQRLALGCALIGDPELLILDEPTTGLDPQARRRVWEIIADFRESGGTVLLTTHYMDEAEKLCDEIVVIDHGHAIATGTPEKLVRTLGAEQLIEFEVEGELALDDLRGVPGVVDGELLDATVRLRTDSNSETIARILAWTEERSLRPSDLRMHRPNLEDVFVHLTGRSLRDG